MKNPSTNTAHVGAPWKVVPREVMEDGSVYPRHIVGGATELEVCVLESQSVAQLRHDKPGVWPSEGAFEEPNARLIAAAPDLLEAPDTLYAIVGLTAFKHEGQRAALQEAMDRASAVMKKARGQ